MKSTRSVYIALTILVWGLFAADRGLWQDDVLLLERAFRLGPAAFFDRGGGLSSTRLFLVVPYALAILTPRPTLFLQLLYGVVWLALGVTANRLALELFPGRRRLAFAAGGLVLTATADLLTNSLVILSYNVSLLAFFGSTLWFLRWCRTGGVIRLAVSCLLLTASVWMTDGALASMALVPLLAWLVHGRNGRSRVAWGACAWGATAVSYLVVLGQSLLMPGSYASSALKHDAAGVLARRAVRLFAYNFEPWLWAFSRPVWFGERPSPVLPGWLYAAVVVGGTTLFWRALRARPVEPALEEGGGRARWSLAVALLVMAAVVNAAFANVQLSEACYRTHLVSRVWASLFLAAAADGIGDSRQARATGHALLCAFVGLGIWGGMERQDYFLAIWARHRTELASIVRAVPDLRPGATLVLDKPAEEDAGYQATEVQYLAYAWGGLLFGPTPSRVTLLCGEPGGGRCRIDGDVFEYAVGDGSRDPRRLRLRMEDVVMLQFSHRAGTYGLLEALPTAMTTGAPSRAYRPRQNIVAAAERPGTHALLAGPYAFARLLAR